MPQRIAEICRIATQHSPVAVVVKYTRYGLGLFTVGERLRHDAEELSGAGGSKAVVRPVHKDNGSPPHRRRCSLKVFRGPDVRPFYYIGHAMVLNKGCRVDYSNCIKRRNFRQKLTRARDWSSADCGKMVTTEAM